jgi:hypothetical protein
MVDFDPGFHDEMSQDEIEDSFEVENAYEAGHEEGYEEGFDDAQDSEPDVETDGDGNVLGVAIGAAAAAGFGYHMAKDEMDEREIAEHLLAERKHEIKKVPLAARHGSGEVKGKPFERWLHEYLSGSKKLTDPLEYTAEEDEKLRSEW